METTNIGSVRPARSARPRRTAQEARTPPLLGELFNKGTLGIGLARRFGGELVVRCPMKDGRFSVRMKPESAIPTLIEIESAMRELYLKHGFRLQMLL